MATHLFSRLRDRIGDKYFCDYNGIEYTVLIRWYGTSKSHVVVSFIADKRKYIHGDLEYDFMETSNASEHRRDDRHIQWLFKKIGVVK
jgi:hypothetical protein